jgi:DNA polymerase II small subunit/DNA polymerase delta subunit B
MTRLTEFYYQALQSLTNGIIPITPMKKLLVAFAALALTLTAAQAQDSKMAKKAATMEAKGEVAADKEALKMNKEARQAAKASGDKDALKAARKDRVKKTGELIKDEAKKDVKVAKEKI